jgi:hypothetical protein
MENIRIIYIYTNTLYYGKNMENQLKNWNINETNVENIWKVHGYNMENCITWWNIFDNYITITKT